MGNPPHHIADLAYDDAAGCAWWRCTCGDVADGYDSVHEARFAAAEHQLPEDVQREIENDVPIGAIEEWRDAVTAEADAATYADPAAWAWYLATGSDGTASGDNR